LPALCGLARGDDVFDLAAAIEELHPRHDTFPGEAFMRLPAGALEVAGVRQDDPVPDAGFSGRYLGEGKFQGRENRKASASQLPAPQQLSSSAPTRSARRSPSPASAGNLFFEIFRFRAIALIGVFSARCRWRMSALSSTMITSLSSAHPVTEGSGFTRGRRSDAEATSSDLAHMLGSLPPTSALSYAYPAFPS